MEILFFNKKGKRICCIKMWLSNTTEYGTDEYLGIVSQSNEIDSIGYGSAYTVEYKDTDGDWREMLSNADFEFTLMEYDLQSIEKDKENNTKKLNWEHLYGALPHGKYRLCKIITIYYKNGESEDKCVHTPFVI